jgi:peptide/nickel transport system permease protein
VSTINPPTPPDLSPTVAITDVGGPAAPARRLRVAGPWRELDPRFVFGAMVVGGFVAMALLAPVIARYNPTGVDLAHQYQAPSAQHWFGTDRLGFDVFSRVVWATPVDLFIAATAVALSILIGLPVGVAVGYWGGRVDGVAMRVLDVVQAFPVLVLAIGVLAALGQGLQNVILVIGLLGVPTYVRLVRTQVRTLREFGYIEAARSVGNPSLRIMRRYIVPGTLGTIAVQAAISCGWAIIMTASLGFLGLGVPVPRPEWGYMIATGVQDMVNGRWWTSIFPGLAIAVVMLGLNLLGESVADLVDPRRRRAR